MLRFRWVLVMSLVFGISATIATAWGFVWYERHYGTDWQIYKTHEERPAWLVRSMNGVGSSRLEVVNAPLDYSKVQVDSAPWWSQAATRPDATPDQSPPDQRWEIAAGFPFRALMLYQDVTWKPIANPQPRHGTHETVVTATHHAIILEGQGTGVRSLDDMYLPYAPIWFGFCANVLIYGIVCVIPLMSYSLSMRARRASRARCIRCGYDIRDSLEQRCSECGQAIGSPQSRRMLCWRTRAALAMLVVELGSLLSLVVAVWASLSPDWTAESRVAWIEDIPSRVSIDRVDITTGTRIRWKLDQHGMRYHEALRRANNSIDFSEPLEERLLRIETRAKEVQSQAALEGQSLIPSWTDSPDMPDRSNEAVRPVEEFAYGWPWRSLRWERTVAGRFEARGALPLYEKISNRYYGEPVAVIPAIPIWRGLIANTIVFAIGWVVLAFTLRWSWRGVRAIRHRNQSQITNSPRSCRTSR